MGTVSSSEWRNRTEMLEYLRRPERFAPHEMVASSARGNHHWYVARRKSDGLMWIGVDLMRGGSRGCPGWGYKGLDETMGPVEKGVPLKFLKMVEGHKTDAYGKQWRAEALALYEATRARPKPAAGMLVKYGGQHYRLVAPWEPGSKFWKVEHVVKLDSGDWYACTTYRMKPGQLRVAEIVDTSAEVSEELTNDQS